jgi:hypothetical protein
MHAWSEAQSRFESAFGAERSSDLRALLQEVTATELSPTGGSEPGAIIEDG